MIPVILHYYIKSAKHSTGLPDDGLQRATHRRNTILKCIKRYPNGASMSQLMHETFNVYTARQLNATLTRLTKEGKVSSSYVNSIKVWRAI